MPRPFSITYDVILALLGPAYLRAYLSEMSEASDDKLEQRIAGLRNAMAQEMRQKGIYPDLGIALGSIEFHSTPVENAVNNLRKLLDERRQVLPLVGSCEEERAGA